MIKSFYYLWINIIIKEFFVFTHVFLRNGLIFSNYFLIEEKCNYQEFLLESSLLITDYSSIFFDFGYLRKPVIYSHFDYEKYRKSHYREGYFDYKYDGFGPVCFNINCTINEIIYEIKNKY